MDLWLLWRGACSHCGPQPQKHSEARPSGCRLLILLSSTSKSWGAGGHRLTYRLPGSHLDLCLLSPGGLHTAPTPQLGANESSHVGASLVPCRGHRPLLNAVTVVTTDRLCDLQKRLC